MKSQKHQLLRLPNVLDHLYHHSKQYEVISVVSEMLESTVAPLSESCEMYEENFDAFHPDGEKSQILSILTAYIDYTPNHIITL